ncbi:MAG TPA: hypothetical protein VIL37_10465 [Natronosporangium sp.]
MSVVTDPPSIPARTGVGRWRLRRPAPAHAALIAVAAAYWLAIILLTPQAMQLSYDESVYASQVAPYAEPTQFSAHRARGMQLLLAPIVAVTDSVVGFRLYLSGLAGLFLYLAFRPWLAVVSGRYAYLPAVAAASFAGLWLTVLYGALAYPNLWLTFPLIAGVGYAVRAVTGPAPARGALVGIAVSFAAASLLRPTDALAAAVPVLAAPVVVRAWRRWWPPVAVAVGLAVGWLAWLIEAAVRFGGPAQRWHASAEATGGGLVNSVPEHLHALDGPLLLCEPADKCAGIDPLLAAWWLALPVLAVVGLVAAARAGWFAAGALAAAAGVAVAGGYLFYLDYAAPRFLLPMYGLLSIPVAGALVWLAGRRQAAARRAVLVGLLVAALVHASAQLVTLHEVTDRLLLASWRQEQRVEFLREQGVRPPCLYWGEGAIQLSYPLRCRSWLAHGEPPAADDRRIAAALASGDAVVVVMSADTEPPAWLAGWRRVAPPTMDQYAVYLRPGEPG